MNLLINKIKSSTSWLYLKISFIKSTDSFTNASIQSKMDSQSLNNNPPQIPSNKHVHRKHLRHSEIEYCITRNDVALYSLHILLFRPKKRTENGTDIVCTACIAHILQCSQ